MLGGIEVNVTGPCFWSSNFLCKWGDFHDAQVTIGETTFDTDQPNLVKGRCIQPLMFYNGKLNLSISLDKGKTYIWRSEYTVGK